MREAALRKSLRETGAARYALWDTDPVDALVEFFGQGVAVLTTPDRAPLWRPLTDPALDLFRWCLIYGGVRRDKVAEVARKTPEQAARSSYRDMIAEARRLEGIIRGGGRGGVVWTPAPALDGQPQNQNYRLLRPIWDYNSRMHPETLVALDFETEGDYPMDLRVVGFSFARTPGEAFYVPLDGETDRDVALTLIQTIVDGPWVAHNAQYELACLATLGITPGQNPEDTFILAWERGEPVLGLKALALEHLGVRMTTFAEVSKGRRFSEVPLEEAVQYGCADADNTLRLWKLFRETPTVDSVSNLVLYERLDKPLVPILAAMTRRGLAVDREWVKQWWVDLERQITALERDIRHTVAEHARTPEDAAWVMNMNLNSPEQVSRLLFGVLDLDPQRFASKAGVYSTDEATLLTLAPEHPIVPMLLEYRGLQKQVSTYAQGFANCHVYGDGRLHPDWKGTGTKTGRLASGGQTWRIPGGDKKAPQAQNVPLVAREAITADPGHVLVAADYSQIELRILAHISDDPKLRAAFAAGRNPHLDLMAAVFGHTDKHKDDGKPYKLSKNINFGTIYGAGANRLREQALEGGIVLTNRDTQGHLDTHKRVHPVVWSYRSAEIERMRQLGYAETLTGRRIFYPDLTSPDQGKRGAAEREAFNARIQGTSGDITKEAMVEWDRLGHNAHWPIVLQVHDEIVVQAPEDEAETALEWLKMVMQRVAEQYLSLPVEVEGAWGRTWKECK